MKTRLSPCKLALLSGALNRRLGLKQAALRGTRPEELCDSSCSPLTWKLKYLTNLTEVASKLLRIPIEETRLNGTAEARDRHLRGAEAANQNREGPHLFTRTSALCHHGTISTEPPRRQNLQSGIASPSWSRASVWPGKPSKPPIGGDMEMVPTHLATATKRAARPTGEGRSTTGRPF
ncbi:hypothetical protein B0J13DRAFT_104561 [Dactylonectria estremocensis]|uniref:Uncharacterized protein n=1 Tax=Dactylonectria estremocensis TaxID=1079267 RepID=A0A9P9IUD9_9HYPO|nr:hypothetical protein B0J13DRAFT_104561 [Dactylonectria estremocensis]